MVKYSFIIPTKDNPEELENLIKSIKKQKFKDYEIVVSDASSTDKCKKTTEKYKSKYILDKLKRGLPYGRNLGLKIARGDWIIWIDGDHILDKTFLIKLNNFIEKNNFKCIAPQQKFIAKTFFQKIIAAGHQFHAGRLPTVIKKEVFKNIGAWDSRLRFYGEDKDFEAKVRKNYGVGISKGSVIYVPTEKNFSSLFRQAKIYGKTLILYLKKHFSFLLVLNLIYHASPLPLLILTIIHRPFIQIFYIWMALFVIEMFVIALKAGNVYGIFVPFIKLFRSTVEAYYIISNLFKKQR